MPPPPVYDVIVVGSGLSGLTAAAVLQEAKKEVLVLEGQDRIGGRMFGQQLHQTYCDFGGQWIGLTHTKVMRLFDRLLPEGWKVEAPTSVDEQQMGKNHSYIRFAGKTYGFYGVIEGLHFPPNLGTHIGVKKGDFDDATQGWAAFTTLANMLPEGGYPYTLARAKKEWAELDTLTYGQWVKTVCKTSFGEYFVNYFATINGCAGPSEACEVSLLHRLWAWRNSPATDLPEHFLVKGGCGQIPHLLAQTLTRPVITGDPVIALDQRGGDSKAEAASGRRMRRYDVEVRTLQGRTYRCRHVVMAMPPALSGRILYTNPTLPSARHQLHMHMPMGTVAKVILLYSTRFWLEQGRSGTVYFSDEGVATAFYDVSEGKEGTGKGKIVCLITGKKYDAFINLGGEEVRKGVLVRELASYLGPDALTPLAVVMQDWPANALVQGAYSSYMTPSGWSRFGHMLIEPHGKVHWAGTETAQKWMGYFEGAVEAGERAAAEVIIAQGNEKEHEQEYEQCQFTIGLNSCGDNSGNSGIKEKVCEGGESSLFVRLENMKGLGLVSTIIGATAAAAIALAVVSAAWRGWNKETTKK